MKLHIELDSKDMNPTTIVAFAALMNSIKVPAARKTRESKTPVAKTPVAKTPVAKTPVAKTPVAKTPVAKTPVAKTEVDLIAAQAVDAFNNHQGTKPAVTPNVPEIPATPPAAKAPAEEVPGKEELHVLLREYSQQHGRDAAIALLKDVGDAGSISAMDPAKIAPFITYLKKAAAA